MFGAVVALLTALSWGGSSIIIKLLTAKIDTLSLNILRLWTGSFILLTFIPLSGRWTEFTHTPLQPLIFIITSGIMGMAIGDSLYIKSLSILDASVAFPISQCSFIVLTVFASVIFLGEPFTWLTWVGTVLVMLGVYFIAVMGRGSGIHSEQTTVSGRGILLVLIAGIFWMIATITLKTGATGVDTYVVAGFRIPASGLVLSFFALAGRQQRALRFRDYDARSIALILATGILSYGISAVGYVKAIQLIGAGKTVLLTATAPLFVLPFSVIILKEKPTFFIITGVILCVGGIYLVIA